MYALCVKSEAGFLTYNKIYRIKRRSIKWKHITIKDDDGAIDIYYTNKFIILGKKSQLEVIDILFGVK